MLKFIPGKDHIVLLLSYNLLVTHCMSGQLTLLLPHKWTIGGSSIILLICLQRTADMNHNASLVTLCVLCLHSIISEESKFPAFLNAASDKATPDLLRPAMVTGE